MHSRLFVIEAPGKIAALKEAAKTLWPNIHCDFLATSGTLFDLPSKELGVHPDTLMPAHEVPLGGADRFLQSLENFKMRMGPTPWKEIWIMTDPDREGEGIAEQVQRLLRFVGIASPVVRTTTYDMTTHGLSKVEKRDIEPGKVMARTARRVGDRLLSVGEALRRGKKSRQGLGRVQLAALQVVNQKTKDWVPFHLSGCITAGGLDKTWRVLDNEQSMFSSAEEASLAAIELRAALKNHERFSSPCVSRKTIEPQEIFNAATMLTNIRELSPQEIMEGAQVAYMAGRLSYPRTDTRRMPFEDQLLMRDIAEGLFLGHLLDDERLCAEGIDPDGLSATEKQMLLQGAHHGVHPSADFNAPFPGGYSKMARTVENHVAARAVAKMMRAAVVEEFDVEFTLPTSGRTITLQNQKWLDRGWSQVYERFDLLNPLVEASSGRGIQVEERYPTAHDIIAWCDEAGLGRPSTLVGIPKKLSDNGWMTSTCRVSPAGRAILDEAKFSDSRLADIDFTQRFEKKLDALEQHGNDSPEEAETAYKRTLVSILMDAGLPPETIAILLSQLQEQENVYLEAEAEDITPAMTSFH